MQNKYKVLIAVVVIGGSFAAGRYTVPEKVRIETKIVEVAKKVADTKKDKNKKTRIVTVTRPDGTKETRKTIVENTKTDKNVTTDTNKASHNSKETVRGDSKVTLSLLGGFDFITMKPTFGASLIKPVFGPVTLGIWGLSNASCGASIGITF